MSNPNNTIRAKLVADFTNKGYILVDFDYRLQHLGTDIRVYANDPQIGREGFTPLLSSMLNNLFGNRTGVERVHVNPFRMEVHFCRAVTTIEILELLLIGIDGAGWQYELLK